MLKNYLTIALRNILRHKTYSFINIAGLAVGMPPARRDRHITSPLAVANGRGLRRADFSRHVEGRKALRPYGLIAGGIKLTQKFPLRPLPGEIATPPVGGS